jgi:hypothetical protein
MPMNIDQDKVDQAALALNDAAAHERRCLTGRP